MEGVEGLGWEGWGVVGGFACVSQDNLQLGSVSLPLDGA